MFHQGRAKVPLQLTSSLALALAVGGLALLAGGGVAGAGVPAGGTWTGAQSVASALNTMNNAQVSQVSCPAANDCTVIGIYLNSSGGNNVFASQETNGTWAAATALTITGSTGDGPIEITGLICSTVGNCTATGQDGNNTANGGALFVASDQGGMWAASQALPGFGALDVDGLQPSNKPVLACSSAGNCVLGGEFLPSGTGPINPLSVAFVDDQVNGTWGTAHTIPGLAGLDLYDQSFLTAASCASNGSCEVGGRYQTSGDGNAIASFVAGETNHTWHDATQLPATADTSLNEDIVELNALSCSGGIRSCVAVGGYIPPNSTYPVLQPFTATEQLGSWNPVVEAPLDLAMTGANLTSISCSSAGTCGAAGLADLSGSNGAYLLNEVNGTWGNQQLLGGLSPTGPNPLFSIGAISCVAADTCVFDGNVDFGPEGFDQRPFVAAENGHSWDAASSTPLGLSSSEGGLFTQTACAPSGTCVAAGTIQDITTGHASDELISYERPTISSVTPDVGRTTGGNTVTITGTSLNGSDLSVYVGSKKASVLKVVSSNELQVTAPAGKGAVRVVVDTSLGASTPTGGTSYAYEGRPVVTKVGPSHGSHKGGTEVTIHGTGLLGATAVHFGSHTATGLVVVNSTELQVLAPAGSGSAKVKVTTPIGTSAASSKAVFKYT